MIGEVESLPIIDVSPLVSGGDSHAVAQQLDRACRQHGFFYVTGHGVDDELQDRLDAMSREFFDLPEDEKAAISMDRGGRAWRGWFPVGGELTSGVPDLKEGIYFGTELGPDDPRPMHGPNLFPERPDAFGETVLAYMAAVERAAQAVLRGLAVGLGLPASWFVDNLTADPLVLFRIFHYPPSEAGSADQWGVGEHTDYGLLTLLRQDSHGGLQVRAPDGGWIDAPPVENSFVCNIGDMLDRMTGGVYRSTPHRVLNRSGADRLSFPLFLDPGWGVEVKPIPIASGGAPARPNPRWDNADPSLFEGTYGEYVLSKVSKVFPNLAQDL